MCAWQGIPAVGATHRSPKWNGLLVWVGAGLAATCGTMAPQGALNHLRLHGLLELLEGAHLDLAHPLAGDAVLLRQLLERGRVVPQAALDQDVALALVQCLQRRGEQGLAPGQLLA